MFVLCGCVYVLEFTGLIEFRGGDGIVFGDGRVNIGSKA